MHKILYPVLVAVTFLCGCALFSQKDKGILWSASSHPVRPGWSKKDVLEMGNYIFFTGESNNYIGDKEKTKELAIDDAVRFLLKYAGIKDKNVLELFRSDFTPKMITASKHKEKGPYEVMMSDFYWEKYIVKETNKPCYKGYVQLQFTLTKWTEFRNYVRATTEQNFEQKFYEH